MRIEIADAAARLADLIRRAESGEDVVLTRNGRAVARLQPIPSSRTTPTPGRAASTGTLADFLLESPPRGAEIDVTRLKDG